jgi:hypothetical protein
MPPAGFELAIPENERPLTRALDRAATAIGNALIKISQNDIPTV